MGVPPARRLLVVDDVPEILDVVAGAARHLPRFPVEVLGLDDPREAVRRLERERFDAVLSDFRMPHLDGSQVLSAARRLQPHARIALMTGYNELPGEAAALGALQLDAYVPKPVELAELSRVLDALLGDDVVGLARYQADARARRV